MEICSYVEFQSQGGRVVKGLRPPNKPGHLWFHSPPQALHNEFPSAALSSRAYLYQISLLILKFKTFGNAFKRELKVGPFAHHL